VTRLTTAAALLGFDPRLPELPLIDDAATVARLLAPGAGSVEVRRQDTKYEPGVRCIAAYEVRFPAGSRRRVLGALVVSGDGVAGYPAERDPALPRLAAALDAAAVAERIADTLPIVGGQVRLSAVPVRYKPGNRCVIRYEVSDPTPPVTWYGKLLASGSERQASLVSSLVRAAAEVEGAPSVLPVVAHWPDLGMLVQPAAQQAAALHGVVSDPAAQAHERRDALMGAGAALAALHCCDLPQAPPRSFADDLAELRAYEPAIACAAPRLAPAYASLVDRLEDSDDGSATGAVVSHGAFRTDQLLGTADDLVLIDLDTVCRAEPARDIGNLLAYLEWKAIRRPNLGGALAGAAGAFVDGYASRRGPPAPSGISRWRAASLLKIAGRRFRSLAVDEWHVVPALLSAAGELIARSS